MTDQAKVLNVPSGIFCGFAGGCQSEFKVNNKQVVAKFSNGVRGFNINDIITVDDDGTVTSNLLGVAVEVAVYEV